MSVTRNLRLRDEIDVALKAAVAARDTNMSKLIREANQHTVAARRGGGSARHRAFSRGGAPVLPR